MEILFVGTSKLKPMVNGLPLVWYSVVGFKILFLKPAVITCISAATKPYSALFISKFLLLYKAIITNKSEFQ